MYMKLLRSNSIAESFLRGGVAKIFGSIAIYLSNQLLSNEERIFIWVIEFYLSNHFLSEA